ncbi:MAG: nucleotidyltransferase family protein [Candidatus Omnitrophica bacterium]|nr:nucleotidyltransferase family protein [Candidatus Omnitrophota bacterium]
MKALILAAGYATRMYPLTRDYPKPLLLVRNKPIVDYIVEKLEGLDGLDEIILVTNSKFISSFRRWMKRKRLTHRLTLVDDLTTDNAHRRGAIGDIDFVLSRKKIRQDLLVIGGDNLFDGTLQDFLRFARGKAKPVIGAYDIKSRAKAAKYGVIRLDRSKRVIDFKEKPAKPASTLVAMCLYYFPKDKLGLIRQYLRIKSHRQDATGFYIDWLKNRCPAYGFVFKGRWYDIGDYKYYYEAKRKFAKK